MAGSGNVGFPYFQDYHETVGHDDPSFGTAGYGAGVPAGYWNNVSLGGGQDTAAYGYVDFDEQEEEESVEEEEDEGQDEQSSPTIPMAATRRSRGRVWPKRSDPHVVYPSLEQRRRDIGTAPTRLCKGADSGRNMLARFQDKDDVPRLAYNIRLDCDRPAKKWRGYPATGAMDLKAGLSLEQILAQYPNHVWNEGLRLFNAEGWTAEQMWNLLPTDARNDGASTRKWNYLQQALGREADEVYKEQHGQKRRKVSRPKKQGSNGGANVTDSIVERGDGSPASIQTTRTASQSYPTGPGVTPALPTARPRTTAAGSGAGSLRNDNMGRGDRVGSVLASQTSTPQNFLSPIRLPAGNTAQSSPVNSSSANRLPTPGRRYLSPVLNQPNSAPQPLYIRRLNRHRTPAARSSQNAAIDTPPQPDNMDQSAFQTHLNRQISDLRVPYQPQRYVAAPATAQAGQWHTTYRNTSATPWTTASTPYGGPVIYHGHYPAVPTPVSQTRSQMMDNWIYASPSPQYAYPTQTYSPSFSVPTNSFVPNGTSQHGQLAGYAQTTMAFIHHGQNVQVPSLQQAMSRQSSRGGNNTYQGNIGVSRESTSLPQHTTTSQQSHHPAQGHHHIDMQRQMQSQAQFAQRRQQQRQRQAQEVFDLPHTLPQNHQPESDHAVLNNQIPFMAPEFQHTTQESLLAQEPQPMGSCSIDGSTTDLPIQNNESASHATPLQLLSGSSVQHNDAAPDDIVDALGESITPDDLNQFDIFWAAMERENEAQGAAQTSTDEASAVDIEFVGAREVAIERPGQPSSPILIEDDGQNQQTSNTTTPASGVSSSSQQSRKRKHSGDNSSSSPKKARTTKAAERAAAKEAEKARLEAERRAEEPPLSPEERARVENTEYIQAKLQSGQILSLPELRSYLPDSQVAGIRHQFAGSLGLESLNDDEIRHKYVYQEGMFVAVAGALAEKHKSDKIAQLQKKKKDRRAQA